MAYKALYRTYRPKDFSDFSGQKHIVVTLQNAIASNKIAHAYLFSGPRGTGKTSMAKIFAKAINCTHENKPCNECENCTAINENSHPDIIEIDAASNNGIDEIRDLIEKVKYAPLKGKYKVYIIDEVHMMTSGAFNALLKTLEEPPAHVVFILATTDVHKVIPTVLSRCQRFDFNKLSYYDIKQRVEEVLAKENIVYEDKVSDLIAELADGGMRDALSILDQVLSYATNNIALQHIYDIYGIMSTQGMCDYLNLLINGKTKEVLEMIEQYIEKGIDIRRLTYDLMVIVKDSIIFRNTSDDSILEKLNRKQASELLNNYKIEDSIRIVEIFNEALNNYRVSTNYRLFFELASLKAIESLSSFTPIEPQVVYIKQEVPKNETIEVYQTKDVVNTQINEEDINTKEDNKINETSENKITDEENIEDIIDNQEDIEEEKTQVIEKNIIVENSNQEKLEEDKIIEYELIEYVNIVNQGDKKFKLELNSRWEDIKNYLNDTTYGQAARLVVDSLIGAANKNYIFLVYTYQIQANRAKQYSNLLLIRDFFKQLFGYDFEVYVTDHSTFVDITTNYFSLRQANKLPPISPIPSIKNLQTDIVEQQEDIIEETIEIGKELFGDMLNIKEN